MLYSVLAPSLSLCRFPDDLSSVSLTRSKSLDIDWDPTGGSKVTINNESAAMNSSLTHPNMKGRIIIWQRWESDHVFLMPLSYKLPLLSPQPQESPVSTPKHASKHTLFQWYFDDFRWKGTHRTCHSRHIFIEWLLVLKSKPSVKHVIIKTEKNEVQLQTLQVLNGSLVHGGPSTVQRKTA